MCKTILLACVMNVINIHFSHAQCLGSCCAAANTTGNSDDANFPDKGQGIIGISLHTLQYHPLSDDELLQWAQPDASVYSVASQWSVKGSIYYGISDRISASFVLPYNSSFENKEGHYHINDIAEIHSYGNIRGMGDGSMLVNYQLLPKNKKGWNAYAGAGLKIPTGKTDAASTYEVVLPVHLQPGTGSWDPIAQVSANKKWTRFTLGSTFFARIATTALEHNMGDYFRTSADASYALIPASDKFLTSLIISCGLVADHNTMMKIAGAHNHDGSVTISDSTAAMITFPNSGFTRLIAQAGISCILAKHLAIPLQFSAPFWQHLDGHQPSLQWTASAGLNYTF